MAIRTELTLVIENKPGAAARVFKGLADDRINIVAMQLEHTGLLRIVVDNPLHAAELMRERWRRYGLEGLVPLVAVPSPYRSTIGPFLDYLDSADAAAGDGQLASVVVPEFVPARWWQHALHNQTAWLLKLALLYRRRRLGKNRVIIEVPFYLKQ